MTISVSTCHLVARSVSVVIEEWGAFFRASLVVPPHSGNSNNQCPIFYQVERRKVNQNRHLICTESASEYGIIGVPNKVKRST